MSATAPDALPHRFPFRLVASAAGSAPGRVAVVLATACDALAGAGPWPLSLVVEALAQAILLVHAPREGVTPLLLAVDRARLLQEVRAGDRLEVTVEPLARFGALSRFRCRAVRSGALAAVAEITVSG